MADFVACEEFLGRVENGLLFGLGARGLMLEGSEGVVEVV